MIGGSEICLHFIGGEKLVDCVCVILPYIFGSRSNEGGPCRRVILVTVMGMMAVSSELKRMRTGMAKQVAASMNVSTFR